MVSQHWVGKFKTTEKKEIEMQQVCEKKKEQWTECDPSLG